MRVMKEGHVEARGFMPKRYTTSELPTCQPGIEGLIVLTQGYSSDNILCYCHDTPAGQGGRTWTNVLTGHHGSATDCPDTPWGGGL